MWDVICQNGVEHTHELRQHLMTLLAMAIKTYAVSTLQVLSESLYWTAEQVTQGIAMASQDHTASLAVIVLVTVLAVLLGCTATAYHILRE